MFLPFNRKKRCFFIYSQQVQPRNKPTSYVRAGYHNADVTTEKSFQRLWQTRSPWVFPLSKLQHNTTFITCEDNDGQELTLYLRWKKFILLHLYKEELLRGWIWVVLHWFSPDELLDVLFSAWWLLKIKTKWHGTNWFIIDVMKGWKIWVT